MPAVFIDFSYCFASVTVSFVSDILGMNSRYQDVLREWLDPWVPANVRWILCYRASDHSFRAKIFHKKCGSTWRVATITLIKVGGYVFGGFADQSWRGK